MSHFTEARSFIKWAIKYFVIHFLPNVIFDTILYSVSSTDMRSHSYSRLYLLITFVSVSQVISARSLRNVSR